MSEISSLGERQQSLLAILLHHRNGLTVDALASMLEISRNAVNQHLLNLSGSGFIQNTLLNSTGGRPSKVYSLTPTGLELFPRHYSFLARMLLSWLKKNLGKQELESCLKELGEEIAHEFSDRVSRYQTQTGKVREVTTILQELGYDAETAINTETYSEIIASNCVFQKLAEECHSVCTLDLSFLASLLDTNIEHKKCIVKGSRNCCFGISTKTPKHAAQ